MLMQKNINFSIILLFISIVNISAQDIAVLVSNFTTISEEESKTFLALFAKEYNTVTNKNVYDISKAQEIYKENDYNIVSTSETIQVSEYIVITAITVNQKIILDAVLYDRQGNNILKAENSALSIDELPNACTHLATSLASKSNATKPEKAEIQDKDEEQERQEDFFQEKIIGFKTGIIQPYHKDTSFEAHITVGFNMKIESKKFFIEFGAGPLLPSIYEELENNSDLVYGGVNLEFGTCFYLSNNPAASVYLGGGLNPRILLYPSQTVINPYFLCGLMFLRKSSMRVFTNIRITQHILKLKYSEEIEDSQNFTTSHILKYKTRPLELGLEVGIGW